MKTCAKKAAIVLFLGILAASWIVAEDIPLKNWAAPVRWSPTGGHGLTTLSETNPLPFIALSPCRIVDTRGPAGPYGAPALSGGVPRDFTLSGQCGIPASALAASLNVTVTNTQGPGFILIYPQGGSQPAVSTLNYVAGQTIANAAIVPLSAGGAITVIAGVSGTDLLLDVNGYFPNTTPTNQLALGESFGIAGSVGGGVILGTNLSTAAGSYGVKGVATGTGLNSAGLFGLASATSGVLYGALGQESSTTADSAGLRGVDGTGSPGGSFSPSGVRGESASGFGVLGTSRFVGVDGALLNTSGMTIADGRLGFSTGGTNYGVYSAAGDIGATGTKSFVVPHPTDPSRIIRYISMEGPEAGTYFRGRGRLEDRIAVIDVPESFRLVTEEDGLSIQVTPIGGPASLWIQEVGLDRIVVRGPRDLDFFYTVNGVRKGYVTFEPMSQGSEFVPESPTSRLPEGLNPETKRRLIANGTYNPDGTVNMDTAERLGWTKLWASRKPSERE